MKKEYYEIVKDILESDEFQRRKSFKHHGNITVYEHCLKVSKLAYKISKLFKNVDINSVIIGALLHDFYKEPWQSKPPAKNFFKKHGFTHANEAYLNVLKHYPEVVNKKVEDIITKHMFPLNISFPKYKESWIVTISDKIVSLEVVKKPLFFLALFFIYKNICSC